ncbi:hypothetical protein AMATHDRAFT_910 [Amanita thiersii Skay4041]|uniref:Uncharacterized protein n=1 Tax=Amanita thiersii Skay4041 TaxID=703135 RepID=A0A2A9NZZ5_9AGAR|nr:hypothetical protein AMATHDRAFT_910 [Amanita thiersii Skay4041]
MYDQGVHDQVNLARLVRRLEKSVAPEEWNEVSPDVDTWLKAERVLQRVKFARKLLKNCEEFGNTDPKKSQLYEEWRLKLEGYETTMNDIHARATPTPKRPPPILPSIPVPKVPSPKELDAPSVTSVHSSLSETGESGPVESLSLPANDLLLSPSDTTPLPSASLSSATPTLIPSNFPSSSKSSDATAVTTGVSRFLQNSNSLHQELSEQLAQMAVQLKRNALHFSDSLVKDKAVVEDAQQKVESNFDVMQKERIRLRDHRGKSTSTTCLVVAIILVVVLLFALMVVLIRLTRII